MKIVLVTKLNVSWVTLKKKVWVANKPILIMPDLEIYSDR